MLILLGFFLPSLCIELGFLELTKDENDHLMANYVLVQSNLFLVSEIIFFISPIWYYDKTMSCLDSHLELDYPRNIPAKFAVKLFSGFR
jgi:hypothetical protein